MTTQARSNKDILEKAINLAIDGGYNETQPDTLLNEIQTPHDGMNVNDIIFNHDFAKSLFGEHTINPQANPYQRVDIESWKWHLMNMVIAPDPIQYLGEHLERLRDE